MTDFRAAALVVSFIHLVPVGHAFAEADRASDGDVTRSGSRLRAVYFSGTTGFRQLRGLHDRKLDVACNFALDDQDQLRCLPTWEGYAQFLDAECTQPVVAAGGFAHAPGDLATLATMTETFDLRFSAVEVTGPLVEQPVIVYARFGTSSCEQFDQLPGYYPARAVASSRFVRGREEKRSVGGSRIQAIVVRGDDGSVEHARVSATDQLRYFDAALGEEVEWRVTRNASLTDKSYVWAPLSGRSVAFGDTFSDASCRAPVVQTLSEDPPGPEVIVGTDATLNASCSAFESRFYHVSETPVTEVFEAANGVCTASDVPPYPGTFERGAPVRRREFVTGTLQRVGTGRLQALRIANADGSVARVPALYDRAIRHTCLLGGVVAGPGVCLPYEFANVSSIREDASSLVFTDAACTAPAIQPFGLGAHACFAGTVQTVDFDDAEEHATVHVGTRRVAEGPVPLFYSYVDDAGVAHCEPSIDGIAYRVDTVRTVPLETLGE